jgi:hypothetical protein
MSLEKGNATVSHWCYDITHIQRPWNWKYILRSTLKYEVQIVQQRNKGSKELKLKL